MQRLYAMSLRPSGLCDVAATGEEGLQVVRDELFEQDEPVLSRGRLDRHEPRQARRHFDARDVTDIAGRRPFAQLDGKRER